MIKFGFPRKNAELAKNFTCRYHLKEKYVVGNIRSFKMIPLMMP